MTRKPTVRHEASRVRGDLGQGAGAAPTSGPPGHGGVPAPLRRFCQLRPTPWATGAGVTREVVSYHESRRLATGRPPWRLSIADLTGPGPFSRLPGITRTFVPIDSPVELRVDGETQHIAAATPFSFAGDSETTLVRLTAPCRAVNLMVKADDPDPAELLPCRFPGLEFPTAVVVIALTAGRGISRFDVWRPSAALDGLGVRQWLAVR
ncbi:HutD family protein [Micromonospora sp. CPCC 206060]|uniref:HutD family protein n=1 Tax=Micromonospora sp. CPCC 206060 TaxID=3122406 RepID=UPI002FF2E6F4